jgi:hypothetical protein
VPLSAPHHLLIFEGIMGSGKSTTSTWLSRRLREAGYKTRLISEGTKPHPTTLLLTLQNWMQPWTEIGAAEYSARWLERWQGFVGGRDAKTLYVYDGQVFHGDMTSLLMMDAPQDMITATFAELCRIIAPMQPLMIYLYQNDVRAALEHTVDIRSKHFERRQVAWKVNSPYCQRRGYSGVEGWFALYEDYRAMTDRLVQRAPFPVLSIENSAHDYAAYEAQIKAFVTAQGLDIPPNKDK